MTSAQIWSLFQQEYVESDAPLRYVGHELTERDGRETIVLTADVHGGAACCAVKAIARSMR